MYILVHQHQNLNQSQFGILSFSKYIYIYINSYCGIVARVLDFDVEGPAFDPLSGHVYCTLKQGTLHVCVPLYPGVKWLSQVTEIP